MEYIYFSSHRDLELPRPANNLDVVRCTVTFDTTEELRKGVAALSVGFTEGLGGVGRMLNGFDPTFGEFLILDDIIILVERPLTLILNYRICYSWLYFHKQVSLSTRKLQRQLLMFIIIEALFCLCWLTLG